MWNKIKNFWNEVPYTTKMTWLAFGPVLLLCAGLSASVPFYLSLILIGAGWTAISLIMQAVYERGSYDGQIIYSNAMTEALNSLRTSTFLDEEQMDDLEDYDEDEDLDDREIH